MTLLPFEQYTNFIQMAVTLFFSNWVWLQARRTTRETAVHIFAAGLFSFFLGDLFWTAHLLVKGVAAAAFCPADVAWIGLFIWFFGAMRLLRPENAPRPWWVWALTALVPANYVVWVTGMQGDLLTNALWGIVMTLLMWQTACCLAGKEKRLRPFACCVLAFLLLELVLFLSWGAAYAILDLLVTVSVVAMSLTLIKGVRHDG
ncbi:MAG: hypothetical protein LKJ90_02735 [Faecalibacterium sp.]|jgi:hypothetical protein|nr:hypothetical protein [Faecalibacterium sp.]